ncbi:MAG: hypothetical protein ACRC2K_07390 [Clostridium sp.]
MANVLQNLSEELGLTYYSKDNTLYGDYRGFKVIVKNYSTGGVFIIKVPFASQADDAISLGNSLAVNVKALDKRISECTYENNCITVKLASGIKSSSNRDSIVNILTEITTFGFSHGFVTTCENCGTQNTGALYEINKYPVFFCDSCYSSFTNEMNSLQQEFKEKNSNIATGIVGALIGSLIGVALWVIIYSLGYIAAICGFVLAVCAIKGYELLGGKLNKVGIIITAIITIAMVYVATYLSYGFEIYNTFKDIETITIFDAIKSVGIFKEAYPEIASAFTKDLLMGYLFTGLGAISTFFKAYKTSNYKYTTKNIEQ